MRGILDLGQAERAPEDKRSLHLIISQVVSQYNHNAHLISHNHNVHTENHQDGAACQELRYLFPHLCPPKRHQYPDRQLSICMTLGNRALSKARAGDSFPSRNAPGGRRWEFNGWVERGGTPIHAWLFFLGFLIFPIWWFAAFIGIPKTRRIGAGETEKGVVLDDPQVEHGELPPWFSVNIPNETCRF
jgi:hypothetical protein